MQDFFNVFSRLKSKRQLLIQFNDYVIFDNACLLSFARSISNPIIHNAPRLPRGKIPLLRLRNRI